MMNITGHDKFHRAGSIAQEALETGPSEIFEGPFMRIVMPHAIFGSVS